MRLATKTSTATTLLLLATATQAVPVTYSFQSEVAFNPNATVGIGGENAETFVNEVIGSGGSSGSALLSGSFSYESDTSPDTTSGGGLFGFGSPDVAVYSNAITGADVNLGENTAQADIDGIRANGSTSRFGIGEDGGGSCASDATCAEIGESFTATGTITQVFNDTDVQVGTDDAEGDAPVFENRDALTFGIGNTDLDQDYSPLLNTSTFGEVYVDEVLVTLISQESPDFFDTVDLPNSVDFLDEVDVGTSIIGIGFDGPNIDDGFSLSGELTQVEAGDDLGNGGGNGDDTAEVPSPGALLMMATGLVGLGLRRLRS